MQFQITNTRIENGKLIVFYRFSNGEINSQTFDEKATVIQIMKWGKDRAKWFDDRDLEIKRLEDEARELPEFNQEPQWQ